MLRWRSRQLLDEACRVQPHEAGVAEELDACLLERRVERGVEGLARGENPCG